MLIGCAGAAVVAGVAWSALALRTPAAEQVPASKPIAQAPAAEPTATPVSEPVAERSDDPIVAPEKGSAERTEMMDAIRTYADNDRLIFVVDALLAQGDWALADVHPTDATNDGEFGRMWCALHKDEQGWFVDDAMEPSEPDVEAAQGRWAWASTELLERFFSASANGDDGDTGPTAALDGASIESLSREHIKLGLVFVLEKAHVMDVVRNTPSGPARVASQLAGDYRFLADGSQVKITSDEMDMGQFDPNNRPTLVLRVTAVTSGVPADRVVPITVELVRAQ
jgi:hypothetical protein